MLAKPSAKTNATQQKFRTEGGPAVREYCPHLTKEDCRRWVQCCMLHVAILDEALTQV